MSQPEHTPKGVAAPKPLNRTQRLAAWLGPSIIRLLAATWRIRIVGAEGLRARRAARAPVMFSLWHGTLLPLVWVHRGEGAAVLISEHRDGEVIARIVERLGFTTVRGSTSRGAARALLAMTRTLQSGVDVAVTPDGPRGPRHTFAPGALIAAHRAGVPIVAVGMVASRAWRLRSWDQFMIPKPFATVTVSYSEPTLVEANDVRGASDEVVRFQALMQATEVEAQAEANAKANAKANVKANAKVTA